ncbi:MAG: YaiI/YqxD family protein, partial [Deltaproteobacteria bacterium]|nr:YaiI/YqxD family protein [Deltaproteobacteria bacterium]
MTIWVDADAAPRAVKEILVRASQSRRVHVVLVANRWIPKPKSAFV